jgi:hypothetical protein
VNREVGQLWVDALRSGRYRQGRHFLGSPAGFCCLGVLCELARAAGVIPGHTVVRRVDFDGSEIDAYSYDGNDQYLPESVKEWAELDHQSPAVTMGDRTGLDDEMGLTSLALLNDAGETFESIADVIEQHLIPKPAPVSA